MGLIKKYRVPSGTLDLREHIKSKAPSFDKVLNAAELRLARKKMAEQNRAVDAGYLDGVTVTPNGNRSTTWSDWEAANRQEREAQEKADLQQQTSNFVNNITNTRDEFGKKYVMPFMMSAMSPAALIPGLAGWAGVEGVNSVVQGASNGKYEGWGDFMSQMTGTTNPYGQIAWEFTNPGGLLAGLGVSPSASSAQKAKQVISVSGRRRGKVTPDPKIVQVLQDAFSQAGIAPDDYQGAIDYILNFNPSNAFSTWMDMVRAGYSTSTARPLFRKYVKDLKALGYSDKDLLNELYLMGQKAKPLTDVDTGLVQKFLELDVTPRVMKQLNDKFSLTPEQQTQVTDLISNLFNNIDMVERYAPEWVGGQWDGSNIRVPIGTKMPNNVLAHEAHHAYREKLAQLLKSWGYKMSGKRDLRPHQKAIDKYIYKMQTKNPEYTPQELQAMAEFKYPLYEQYPQLAEDLMPTSEQGATLSQLRFEIFEDLYNQLNRYPTPEEVNRVLENLSFKDLILRLDKANDYGKNFAKGFENDFINLFPKIKRTLSGGLNRRQRPDWVSNSDWNNLIFSKALFGNSEMTKAGLLATARREAKKRLSSIIRNGISTVGSVALPIGAGAYAEQELFNPQYNEDY